MSEPGGRRSAVFIATERYTDSSFETLRAPARDAKALSELLTKPEVGGFATGRVLVDESKTEVEATLEELLASANNDDLVLIYYSGHGVRDRFGDFYLTFVTTKRERLDSTALSADLLRRMIEKSAASAVVIVLDCCYSGAFLTSNKGSVASAIPEAMKAGEGLYVLCSSDALQPSEDAADDASDSLSRFTREIVDGIRSGYADVRKTGVITPDDLWVWTSQQLSTTNQHPTKGGRISSEISLARVRNRIVQRADSLPVYLGDLLGKCVYYPEYGPRVDEWPPERHMIIPVGNLYRPGESVTEPALLDLAHVDYNVGIVGGPRSGKSGLLQAAVMALALTHEPQDVSFIGIEGSGNALGAISRSPHFLDYVGPADPDGLSGLSSRLGELLVRRQELFRTSGLESMYDMREYRKGQRSLDYADFFVVIDNIKLMLGHRAGHDIVELLLNHGSSYGIHFIATAGEWQHYPPELRANCLCKIELRLSDPSGTMLDRETARELADSGPGWAALGNTRFKAARPWYQPVDGTDEPATGSSAKAISDRFVVVRADLERNDGSAIATASSDHTSVDVSLLTLLAGQPGPRPRP